MYLSGYQRLYATINALLVGRAVTIDGVSYIKDGNGQVHDGDIYIAERNTGPEVLVAEKVCTLEGQHWVRPVSMAYSYDYHECVKVKRTGN